jgi:hypothetical protein
MLRVSPAEKRQRLRLFHLYSVIHGTRSFVLFQKRQGRGLSCASPGRERVNAQFRPRPRHRENRAAHSLMPPLRRTNAASGSPTGL